jgi:tartrate dehydrogenase/decarboxylase/D-malate dehydrogenase
MVRGAPGADRCHDERIYDPACRPSCIAAIPGDGIGGEVLEADARAHHVADVDVTTFPWGSDYRETGRMLPSGARLTQRFDAIYFGAVGSPMVPDHVSLWGLSSDLPGFDQWANVRPLTFYVGLGRDRRSTGSSCARTPGQYAGLGGRQLARGRRQWRSDLLFTDKGCERIIRFAFELAHAARRHLTASPSPTPSSTR